MQGRLAGPFSQRATVHKPAVPVARLMDSKSTARAVVRRNLPFIFPRILFGGCSVVAVIALLFAVMRPLSHRRIPMNQMRTSHAAVQFIAAERQYAAKFPAIGFTCDLSKLEKAGLLDHMLASGHKAGYDYKLYGCDSTMPAAGFFLTAVPSLQGRTGEVVFCANQEGLIWYTRRGSIEDCFKARTRWIMSDQPTK